MFILQSGEYISANCAIDNGINLSLLGQGNLSTYSESGTSNNLVIPITSSTGVVFAATEQTMITHIIFTNIITSIVSGINLYLNGVKIVSNISIKPYTTVTLDSGGFTQYPLEPPVNIINVSGGGGTSYTDVSDGLPSGTIDGVNGTFTIAHTPVTGSFSVYLNGQRLVSGIDYTLVGTTLTMTTIPYSTDTFVVEYSY